MAQDQKNMNQKPGKVSEPQKQNQNQKENQKPEEKKAR